MAFRRSYAPLEMMRIESVDRRSEDLLNMQREQPRRRTLIRAAQVCLQCGERDWMPPKDIADVAENGYAWFTKDEEIGTEVEGILAWSIFLADRNRWPARLERYSRPIVLFVYITLALVETPTWCIAESTEYPIWNDCGDREVILRSQLSGIVGPLTMRIVHSFCLAVLFFLTGFEYRLRHGKSWPSTYWKWLNITSILVALALSLAGILLDTLQANSEFVRATALVSVLLRPIVLLGLNTFRVQRTAERLWVAAKAAAASIGLMVAVLLSYSWIGMVLFAFQTEGIEFMDSIENSVLNMFITMTTANFPMVMMAVYSQYRFACLFFISFLVLNLYILQNVILADVSHGYKEKYKEHLQDDRAARLRCAEMAFGLLAKRSASGELSVPLPYAQALAEMHLLSYGLDRESAREIATGNIEVFDLEADVCKDDFVDFCRAVRPPDPMSQAEISPIENMESWQVRMKRLQRLEELVDTALFISMLVAATKTALVVSARSVAESKFYLDTLVQTHCSDFQSCAWPVINTLLTLLHFAFVVELVWKVRTFGFYWFWHMAPLRNPLDVLLVTSGVSAEVLTAVFPKCAPLGPRLPMVIWICRSLVRLSLRVHPWLVLFRALLFLVAIFKGLFAFVCIWFMLFATMGTHIFGGRIRLDSERLIGTAFAEAADGIGYYANNFNDIASATVTLFELMVINDWWVLTGGFAAVLPEAPWFAWVFAIVFWAGTCLFVLNVCTGMVVESLVSIRTKGHRELSSYFLGMDDDGTRSMPVNPSSSLRTTISSQVLGYRTSTHDMIRLRDELLEDVLG